MTPETALESVKETQKTLIDSYKKTRAEKELMGAELEQIEEHFRAAEKNLWDFIDALGLTALNTPDFTFLKSERAPSNVPKPRDEENFQLFVTWLEEEGTKEDFFTYALDQKALNDLVKFKMAEGEPLPPGLDFPTKRRYITMKKK